LCLLACGIVATSSGTPPPKASERDAKSVQSFFVKKIARAKPGYIIFAELNDGGHHKTPDFSLIDHTGVITTVSGTDVYITQHSPSYQNISLFRQKGHMSWYRASRHLFYWIVVPSRKV
jgi:hypothetical protein